jgi:HEAT repeat protein
MTASELAPLSATQLVEQLGDPDWQERDAAFVALQRLGSECVPAIVQGLGHEDAQVRLWCADLMDHLADDRCADPLRVALDDPSPDVRRHAVHSLGCQRCKVEPLAVDIVGLLCERVLHDSSIRVRRVAVHQLGLQPHDTRAVEVLETILRDETDEKLLSRARFALRMQQGEK